MDALSTQGIGAAVFDLPSAYVELCQDHSTLQSKEITAALKGGGDHDPPELSHDHEHTEEDSGAFQEDAFQRDVFQTGTSADL